METEAKKSAVAVSLHTGACSPLHVRMPTRVETPNVATAQRLRLKNAAIPSTDVPLWAAAVFRSAGREVASYCTCRVQVTGWWLFQEILSWAFYTFDSFFRTGLGVAEIG